MKRISYCFLGCILGFVSGSVLVTPFNYWYTTHFVYGDNDSNTLVSVMIFFVWPVSLVIGGFAGNCFYRRQSKDRRVQ